MIVPASIVAQQNAGNQFFWKIAAHLPSNQNNKTALGLAGAISGIHQQHLIIAGGANFPKLMPWEGGKKQYYPEVYVYSIKNNRAIRIQKSIVLPSPLAYAATCTTPLGIVIAGGENESGIQSAAAIIQWDTKKENIGITQLPPLPLPLSNAAVASIDNDVYIAGGESSSGVSNQLFSLNLLNLAAGWKSIATLPHPVSHAVLLAATVDHVIKLFLCGGRRKTESGMSTLYKEVFEYSTSTNQWNPLPSLPSTLSAGTGFFLAPNQLVLLGGDKGIIFNQTEMLLKNIQHAGTDAERRSLIQQKNLLLQSHPGFSNEILIAQYPSMEWKVAAHIPFPAPVTTTIIKGEQGYWIPSGEVKPGIRTPQILLLTVKHPNP